MSVAVGETVELVLDEPSGGGYLWSWELAPGLTELGDAHGVAGAPGATGRRALQLRVDAVGRHRVVATLARPWEARPRQEVVVDLVGRSA